MADPASSDDPPDSDAELAKEAIADSNGHSPTVAERQPAHPGPANAGGAPEAIEIDSDDEDAAAPEVGPHAATPETDHPLGAHGVWQPELPLQMSANHPERMWLPSGGLAAIVEAVGAALAVGPADDHVRGDAARQLGAAFTTTDGAGLEQAISHTSTTD